MPCPIRIVLVETSHPGNIGAAARALKNMQLDELVLAYATTIHKAQGSEYPAVVIPLSTQHYAMLARNLLYTGVTRGKQLVVLVGQRRALAIAVRKPSGARTETVVPHVNRCQHISCTPPARKRMVNAPPASRAVLCVG